ncbi:MAG TPA: PHP domain-containing protein [Epulopiscium sp.]|nr:PHP domain-containing protein [Candidatus Epulonipiscium sp.]
MLIDLHVHSNVSDGTLSPSQVVQLAKEKGLCAIALTDHDTIDGLDEAMKAGHLHQVEIIPGIELSAEFPKDNLHFVGLLIDYKNKAFLDKLRPLKDARKIRNKKMLSQLQALGFNITVDENSSVTTRAHFARALLEGGYVASMEEAFELYLSPGKPGYLKRVTPSPKECIDLIHDAGGIAILAHPTLYKLKTTEIEELIASLADDGLDGIEAIYPLHTPEEETYFIDLAKRYSLIISGGSDFHGDNKPGLELGTGYGNLKIPHAVLDVIKNKSKAKNE